MVHPVEAYSFEKKKNISRPLQESLEAQSSLRREFIIVAPKRINNKDHAPGGEHPVHSHRLGGYEY
jgi:hypothetical protein